MSAIRSMPDPTPSGVTVPALSHCASVVIGVPAARAFDFLLDGMALGHWALGSFNTRQVAPEVYAGHSLFDGEVAYVRPVGDRANWRIDWHVGSTPDHLQPRIAATVVPGSAAGLHADQCQVHLFAWRHHDMSDARWLRLVRCHEVEILLIQAQLERPNSV